MTTPPTRCIFELPFGYVEKAVVYRRGTLRLPTQKDVISVFKWSEEVENPAYLESLLLACMLVSLEDLPLEDFNRRHAIIEQLVQPDVEYLNGVYQTLASGGRACELCGRSAELCV